MAEAAPAVLTGWDGVYTGLQYMLGGWSMIVIWIIAKFSFM